MNFKKLLTLSLFAAVFFISNNSEAAIDNITYQGSLADVDGQALTTIVDMTFSLYDVPVGGTELWLEIQTDVSVENGIFTVSLGSVNSLSAVDFSVSPLYLGVKVGADDEMTPRHELNSVPYAFYCGDAASASLSTNSLSLGGTLAVNYTTDSELSSTLASYSQTTHNHDSDYVSTDDLTVNGGVPTGAMILTSSVTPDTGYTYTGQTVTTDGSWSSLPNMSTYRLDQTATLYNGKIYIIGGYSINPSPENTVEMYDPATETWTAKASMTDKRTGHAASLIGDKIYVTGGYDNGTYLTSVEVYDIALNSWTTMAPMVTPRHGHGASVVNNKIYIFGGVKSSGVATSAIEEYDPTVTLSGTWTTLAPMAEAKFAHGQVVIGGKIYIVGGRTNPAGSGRTSTVEKFDPASGTWTNMAPMSITRGEQSTSVINNKIYVAGSPGTTVEVYDPTVTTSGEWTAVASLSESRGSQDSAVLNGEIYVFGGWTDDYTTSGEKYDPATDTWTSIAPMADVRWDAGVVTYNGNIYVFGGEDGTDPINGAEVFKPATTLYLHTKD